MAGKKSYKSKKPTYKRKNRVFKNRVPRDNVQLGLGFPKKLVVKQKYADTFVMQSNSGIPTHRTFNLNGLYDPDATLGGHQPMYFDQYMAIYNHYTTIGCKMTVKLVPYGSNIVPIKAVLWQNDDAIITPTLFQSKLEQSKSHPIIMGSQQGDSRTLNLNWSARKTFGPPMANTLLRGNVTTNPTETSCGTISIASVDGVTTTTCSVQIMIEYISVYSELRDIETS